MKKDAIVAALGGKGDGKPSPDAMMDEMPMDDDMTPDPDQSEMLETVLPGQPDAQDALFRLIKSCY